MANLLYDALFAPLAGRDRPFLFLPGGGAISGDAFLKRVHRAAGALRACGVEPGDRVAVQLAKSPDALALYGAAVASGAVLLPLNTAYTADELDYFAGNAAPRLMLVDVARKPALGPVAARHGARLETLNPDGSGSFGALMSAQADDFTPEPCGADDLAALLYTSGTTGRSKGAMLSHRNLLSNAEVLVREWCYGPDDVLLHMLPIFHTHGLFVASNVLLLSGGAMIFMPGFDIDALFAHLPAATSLMGVPTFYTRMLSDPRLTRDAVAHMRLFVSGSAPLLAETHDAFAARTGHRILERYGMTETNMITSNPYAGERRAGTVGPPLPGVEVRITDPETGESLPQGQTGRVEVRGPNVFGGYWRMPEKTAEDMRADGFFITGDLGRFEPDGYLALVGRQKDLVITGGFNVYPKEVEEVLDSQPGVLESAVVGVPHPDLGEAVLGVVVPKPGETPDLAAIAAALGQSLARFKQPRALEILDALPRNTMGKVQKTELRARFSGRFTA